VVQPNLGSSVLLQVFLCKLILHSRICALDFGVALLSCTLGLLQLVSEKIGNVDITFWYQSRLVLGMLHIGIKAPVSTLSLHGSSFYLRKNLDW
jgi:hypothetical protein